MPRSAAGVVARQRHGVRSADEQVPGVQAQADGAVVEDALHLGGVLDHRADVRVQGRGDARLRRGGGQPVEVAQQRRPARPRPGPGARRTPPGRSPRRAPAVPAPVSTKASSVRPDRGHGVVPRVVQDHGDEPAHGMKPVVRQHFRPGARLVGQEARRPELRGGQAHLAHLVEHGAGVVLPPPAGHLAHPPRDRRRGDAFAQRAGSWRDLDGVQPAGVHAHDLSGADGVGMPRDPPSVDRPLRVSTNCLHILTLRHMRRLTTIGPCL